MTDRFEFSQSKVKKWRQCHACYYNRYVEGLKRKKKPRPLQFGTMVHEMLEADLNGDDPWEVLEEFKKKQGKLFAAEIEEYGDIVEDCRLIMEAYFDFYKGDKTRPIRYHKQNAEHWLEVPMGEEMLFVMKIDGFARTPNKLRWILEHKTFSRKPNDDDRWRNLQSAVYIRACQMLGMKPFDGIMWNYIKSKAPKIPQILKSGDLSIRDIDTLPSVVKTVMEKHGIEESDNTEELMRRAESNLNTYFFRVFSTVNEGIVDQVFGDFIESATEMMEQHGHKKDRNIGMHCSWCDYEPLCRATLTGGDVDFVKEREYVCSKDKEVEDQSKTSTS